MLSYIRHLQIIRYILSRILWDNCCGSLSLGLYFFSYHSDCLVSVDIWAHPVPYSRFCLTFWSTKCIYVMCNKFRFLFHKIKSISIKDQLLLLRKINPAQRALYETNIQFVWRMQNFLLFRQAVHNGTCYIALQSVWRRSTANASISWSNIYLDNVRTSQQNHVCLPQLA